MTLAFASALVTTAARADDQIGIVLSGSPSGAATRAIAMRIPAEASEGSIPIFLRQTTDSTLYGVRLSATPLLDGNGVASVAPTLDPESHTIPKGGALRRSDLTISGLGTLGTFTSTLYATHGNRTQVLGTLTVVHTLRSNELEIASIRSARSERSFPGAATTVTLLVTVKNNGDSEATFTPPVIASLTSDGNTRSQGDMPVLRVVERDGRSVDNGSFGVAAGEATTLLLVLDGVKETGAYSGTLRISADGHEPFEQSFAFRVKEGPALPAMLIALGVTASFVIRRRYSSGRIGRAGQRRLVERLLSDVASARRSDLERREEQILATLERRLVDISDELEQARFSKQAHVLSEIDHKIDLFSDLLAVRAHVRAISPSGLQAPFESQLGEVAVFLSEATPSRDLDAKFDALSKTITEMPGAVQAAVRGRFLSDVDRFVAAAETSPTVLSALPIRVLNRVSKAKQLADEGRFGEAGSEIAAAQLAFARLLAEELMAGIPDPDSEPPGFDSGWPRFRASTVDALKAVRRATRGERAAESYRRIWQDYVAELATRLRASAARERRKATGARKEQLADVIEACDDAASMSAALDPAAVGAYGRAVEGFLAPIGRKPSPTRLRSLLEDAKLPPPLTIVAARLEAPSGTLRPSPAASRSAASLTHLIRKRHFSLALMAGVVAIPAGLVLLWGPNDTWGDLSDGAAIFAWGFGLQALAALFDARRLGWVAARRAASAEQRATGERPSAVGSPSRMRPEREPAR